MRLSVLPVYCLFCVPCHGIGVRHVVEVITQGFQRRRAAVCIAVDNEQPYTVATLERLLRGAGYRGADIYRYLCRGLVWLGGRRWA